MSETNENKQLFEALVEIGLSMHKRFDHLSTAVDGLNDRLFVFEAKLNELCRKADVQDIDRGSA